MGRIVRHRGADPEDERSFGPHCTVTLREAVNDLCWLLDRGYGIASAAELVGNRYHLTRRQRIAIARCSCSSTARSRREGTRIAASQLKGHELWLDGFNVLTAIETALGGGIILVGRDGCCRDVAGVYSRYHKVAETLPALDLIGRFAARQGVVICRWWLDSPVDNSGRLKRIIQEVADQSGWPWQVEMAINPDRVLSKTREVVSSSDHAILDSCARWFNLTRELIAEQIPLARTLEIG